MDALLDHDFVMFQFLPAYVSGEEAGSAANA
jgi:hypothetical protein